MFKQMALVVIPLRALNLSFVSIARQTHRFEVFVQDQAGRKSNVLEYRFTVLNGVGIGSSTSIAM